ncbi:DUF4229 domain-containing protein [Nocardioides mesophilus]|uniref:DUF4229 domain-containing protein n=1 Tax=Nocardioides mesophilus TaxID=433659 RepID=A0A7G9R6N9_9ACTN|nr:DUF4229 domain-containing protein [Nocardioides mesophilus]QNN51264.1 DUF4229 domain-containing protein [Nocardioides mesophilus]
MKEFAVYTLARLGVFVASYAVVAGIYLLVTGGEQLPLLWPLLLAAAISAVVSYPLLRIPRERFAAVVDRRAHRASESFERARSREDVD